MKDIVKAGPDLAASGYSAGTGLDWSDIGKGLDRRLASFNNAQWEAAAPLTATCAPSCRWPSSRSRYEDGLIVRNDDPGHVDVLSRAVDESRLPGNSLVAAGGWCAPSRDHLRPDGDGVARRPVLVPTIGITRGGINAHAGSGLRGRSSPSRSASTTPRPKTSRAPTRPTRRRRHRWPRQQALLPGPLPAVHRPAAGVRRPVHHRRSAPAARLPRGHRPHGARCAGGPRPPHRRSRDRGDRRVHRGHHARLAGRCRRSAPDRHRTAGRALPHLHRLARGTSLEAVFPYWVHGAIRSGPAAASVWTCWT